jgi:hypothetical protein
MNMRLDALYRGIRVKYIAVTEEIGNIITPYEHRKRPVSVEVPVSIYNKPPGKWSKG